MHDADAEIIKAFEKTRNVTIELAKRIPAGWLSRTPDGEGAPLNALLCHAGCGEAGWLHIFGDGGPRHVPPPADIHAIVDAMRVSQQRTLAFFQKNDAQAMSQTFAWTDESGQELEWHGRERLLYLIAHETHHRGKIVLALRQWGFDRFPFIPF